jgi:hypothetical protein
MPQMYKSFCQKKSPLSWPQTRIFPDHDAFNLKTIKAETHQSGEKGKGGASIALLKNEEKLLKHSHNKLPLVLAGGGCSWNSKGGYLSIAMENGIFLKVKLKIMK